MRVWATVIGVAISLAVVKNALAAGVGFEVGKSITGEIEWTYDEFGVSWDRDVEAFNVSFVVDSAIGSNRNFGYRGSYGYQSWESQVPETGQTIWDFDSLHIVNDFCFAMVNTSAFRLWAGPEIPINIAFGEAVNDPDYKIDYYLSLGVGPAIGVDFILNNAVSIGVKLSYTYSWGWGETYDNVVHQSYDLSGESDTVYLTTSLLFLN